MIRLWIWALTLLAVLVSACRPPEAPASTQSRAPSVVPGQAAPAAAAPKAEEVAWAKIVQDAKKEGRVLIYSFAFAGDVGAAVSKAFGDKYGIKVDVVAGTSPIMLERIRSEYRAKQYMTDIADMSPARVVSLKDDKLTMSVKDLPVLSDKTNWFTHPLDLDPDGHILGYFYSIRTPYINTTLVKPGEEPQSWLDLLQPKWKGKLLVGDPGVYENATVYYAFVKKSKRLTEDYFRQLGGQIGKFVPGGARDQVLVLVRGEGPISVDGSSAGAAPLVAEGAPIRALNLKEGGVASPGTSLVMLSKAPHPNATQLFLNWFMSAEGLRVFAQAASQATVRKDVPDFLHNAARVDRANAVNMDFKDMDEVNKLYNAGYLTKMWKGDAGK